MKRLCSCFLILALFIGVVPSAWAGNDPVFTVGQTQYPFSEDASGSGWSYDAETLTLTLSGLRYQSDDWENYLDFSYAPSEFHLVLAADSENAVGMISLTEETFISGTGSLEVSTVYGCITMNGGTLRANCIYGGDLIVNDGSVILERTKALSSLVVNGGSVTVSKLDTYSLVQHGGTLRASSISNCNGIDVPYMTYCLTGGSLILENTDEDNSRGVFLCVSYSTSPRLLAQALSGFGGMLVDADGAPLVLRYTGYTLDDEVIEGLTGEENQYFINVSANLYNSDGTVANYAEFRPAAACAHQGEKRYRCDEETHWQACVDCGADLPDTKEAHCHLAFGEKKLCICGDELAGDGSVETQAAELALYFWGTGKPMQYALHKVLDQNGDDVITLQEVAQVQLAAEGKAIPEDLAVVSMAYQANGRAKQALSKQGDLSGDWHTAKLYVLEGETSAPLVQPICVFWR